ncbi:DUF2834 domain-containing protein [Flexithrix dorotheae]|uniref:DUF2834 domain-containing protein n=1 Tax=Flexithrix dorotheae TaxID=70993 RepID=UPI00035D0C3D|nr:DUF2834 domain-containing protein [Flexithrix dorotheae]
MNFSRPELIYLFLTILGLLLPWYFNIQFFLTEPDTSIGNFVALTFLSYPSISINMDLTVCLLTYFVWFIPEAIRLKIKNWWIFIVLCFLIAFAFSFPLFMLVRERKLRKAGLRD